MLLLLHNHILLPQELLLGDHVIKLTVKFTLPLTNPWYSGMATHTLRLTCRWLSRRVAPSVCLWSWHTGCSSSSSDPWIRTLRSARAPQSPARSERRIARSPMLSPFSADATVSLWPVSASLDFANYKLRRVSEVEWKSRVYIRILCYTRRFGLVHKR